MARPFDVIDWEDSLRWQGIICLQEVVITPTRSFEGLTPEMKYKYRRTIYNFKKVYPFTLTAAKVLDSVEHEYLALPSRSEKRHYIRQLQKKLMARHKTKLSKWTISQGIMLVKLLDREAGSTSYELIQEYKGSLSAFFWQGIARMFGNNLKTKYQPLGEDLFLEKLVNLYHRKLL